MASPNGKMVENPSELLQLYKEIHSGIMPSPCLSHSLLRMIVHLDVAQAKITIADYGCNDI